MSDDQVLRRYTFKLYPNSTQLAALERQAVLCVRLWNAALEQRETQMRIEAQRRPKGERKYIGYFDQSREVKDIRAADPEWKAMSSATAELVLKRLDIAIQRFWKERKNGGDAGWPRYKSTKLADTIPHRDGSGWKLSPSGETGNACPAFLRKEGANASTSQGVGSTSAAASPETGAQGRTKGSGMMPASAAATPETGAQGRQALNGRLPAPGENGKTWRLYCKGIPGTIRARGKFPVADVEHRDMTLIKRNSAWWMSVAVRMKPRRIAGDAETKIRLDLIDKFATVEVANGGCAAGFFREEEANSPKNSTGFDDIGQRDPAIAGEAQDLGRRALPSGRQRDPAIAGEAQGLDAGLNDARRQRDPAIAGKTQERGSIRWRRERQRAARLSARAAARTKHAAHVWTTAIVAASRSIEVTAPASLKAETASGRGDARQWGAMVKIKAALNRRILDFAPEAVLSMLAYKAAEAGADYVLVEDKEPAVRIGNELVAARKQSRKASRKVRKATEGIAA